MQKVQPIHTCLQESKDEAKVRQIKEMGKNELGVLKSDRTNRTNQESS